MSIANAAHHSMIGGGRRPYDAVISYIAGNSQQSAYIASPYVPQTNDIITAKIFRSQSSMSWLFNTEDHWYGNTSAIGAGTSFGLGWGEPRMNFGKGWSGSATGWTSGLNDIRIEGQVLYVNNSQSISMAGASLSGTTWLALLGNHRGNSVLECALPAWGIGSFTVERSGSVIHDFVSVRIGKGASAIGAMYDNANPKSGPLSNGIFLNSGTGNFTLGSDI